MLLSTKLNGFAINRYISITGNVKKLKLDKPTRIKRFEKHKADKSDEHDKRGGADYKRLRFYQQGIGAGVADVVPHVSAGFTGLLQG